MQRSFDQLANLADTHYRQGNLDAAEQACAELTSRYPSDSSAWQLRATIAYRGGDTVHAADWILRAVAAAPHNAECLTHATEILRRARRFEDAVSCGRRAIELAPHQPAAHNNLGLVFQDIGQWPDAELRFRAAIALDANYAKAVLNLGNLLTQQGRLEEAESALQEAFRKSPNNPKTANALGLVYARLHRYEDAIAWYDRSLKLLPGYPQAELNLANALAELGQRDTAERRLNELLRNSPRYARAWHDLGSLLEQTKRPREAAEAYRQAAEIEPEFHQSFAALENAKRRACDWRGQPECIDKLLTVVRDCLGRGEASPLWPLASLRFPITSQERLAIAKSFAQPIESRVHSRQIFPSAGISKATPAVASQLVNSNKLCIGFLSHEFRHSVVSHLMAALFKRFDREKFRILAFDYSSDDGSTLRRRIAKGCDQFVAIRGMPPRMAADRIAAEAVHILVDINSYMVGGNPEIAAYRPAPVQVSYMYPATMGAAWIDYFITDRFVTPAGDEQHFTERLVYLPDAYLPTDCDQPIADQVPSRSECGLGASGFVYCSFNNADKLEPELFDTWMRILHAVPDSVLWQRCDEPDVQENLKTESAARGVDPDRLVFAPPVLDTSEHLARHRHADLFLDTVLHCGHGTAVDALWAGVPV
ncbi:MAG: tetratricopeptide repeat protein, partial [Planctomycetales bacterium]|nr:tetratricopeptide repeat protein [Planctomycetales bacterium]